MLCCSPWGCRVILSGWTELSWTTLFWVFLKAEHIMDVETWEKCKVYCPVTKIFYSNCSPTLDEDTECDNRLRICVPWFLFCICLFVCLFVVVVFALTVLQWAKAMPCISISFCRPQMFWPLPSPWSLSPCFFLWSASGDSSTVSAG